MNKVSAILLCFLPAFVVGQPSQIDSLKKAFYTAKDTGLVNCLNLLGAVYPGKNTDSALFHAYQALNKAKDIQFNTGVADAYLTIGYGYLTRADYKAAEQNLSSAIGSESPVIINDLVNADGSAAGTEVIITMSVVE
jgi:hypothetical protein